jgi:hypothetical protein
MPVVDAVAIADIEALLAAIAPDRVLHEPWKDFRKCWIELLRIDALGDQTKDLGTAARPITVRAIGMVSRKTAQDARAMQKIVDESIDCYQLYANFEPPGPNVGRAE